MSSLAEYMAPTDLKVSRYSWPRHSI